MMLVPVLSIVALILILADQDWTWLDQSDQVAFAHSITGIIAIGLSVVQVKSFTTITIRDFKVTVTKLLVSYF